MFMFPSLSQNLTEHFLRSETGQWVRCVYISLMISGQGFDHCPREINGGQLDSLIKSMAAEKERKHQSLLMLLRPTSGDPQFG